MVKCSNCQTDVSDDSGFPPDKRTPCPKCGSVARTHVVIASGGIVVGGSSAVVVIQYADALLATAKRLIDNGDFNISVVTAHMACEIAVERAMSATYAAKGLTYLEDAIDDLLNGYNLGNERTRKLFTSLTGKQVQMEGFWARFKESSTRRNAVVHAGKFVTKVEAENTLSITSAMVAYLK